MQQRQGGDYEERNQSSLALAKNGDTRWALIVQKAGAAG